MPVTLDKTPYLDLRRVNRLFDEIVAEYGADHTYTDPWGCPPNEGAACFYVHQDFVDGTLRCGCIVGVLLHKAGVSLEALREIDNYNGDGNSLNAQQAIDQLVEKGLLVVDDHAQVTALLLNVQRRQDAGRPWGYSVTTGRASLDEAA